MFMDIIGLLFNITDSAIMCGVVMLMFYEFFKRPECQRSEKVNSD